MPRRTNARSGQMPRWTNAWTCGFRHLSSWHLSGPNVGSGICPPGICPKIMWVLAFVLLAFVRTNSGSRHLSSWHLSETKYGQGICPPGIFPKQMPGGNFLSDKCQEDKCLESIFDRTNARRTNAWTHIWSGQMPEPTLILGGGAVECLDGQMPGGQMPRWTNASTGICPTRHLSFEAFVC